MSPGLGRGLSLRIPPHGCAGRCHGLARGSPLSFQRYLPIITNAGTCERARRCSGLKALDNKAKGNSRAKRHGVGFQEGSDPKLFAPESGRDGNPEVKEFKTKKQITISELKPGMYVVGLDRSWFQTPFLFHRKLIKDAAEIEMFKLHGIREVVIDVSEGADSEPPLHSEPDELTGAQRPDVAAPTPAAEAASPKNGAQAQAKTLAEKVFRPLTRELKVARTIHDEALALARRIFDGVGSGAPVHSPAARKVVTDLLSSITRSPEANLMLAQMRRFQNDLMTHAVNVCVLSLVVATMERLDNSITALGLGAMLHDVGKTRLPRNLIRRPSGYTEQERRLMERHPTLGATILRQSENIPELAQRIAAEHHERIDGSGYPCGIRGAEIALPSQLVAITDLYDNMLSGRYRPPLQPIEVLRQLYLQSNAGALDRGLIEKVIRCLGVYPIGSLVELNTGERGIVIAANRADSLKPTLRIVSSADGAAEPHGPIVNLAESHSDSTERRIFRALDPAKEQLDVMASFDSSFLFSP